MTGRREWIDIVDWTTILGIASATPCAYLWGSWFAFELWKVNPPGDPFVWLFSVLASIPLSATVGAYGSRWWWVVTAVASALSCSLGFAFTNSKKTRGRCPTWLLLATDH